MSPMPSDDITRRLVPLFATVLKQPPEMIHDELSPRTCDAWDSLNHIHLVSSIEEAFGVMLEFDEQMSMTSFARVRAVIAAALARR